MALPKEAAPLDPKWSIEAAMSTCIACAGRGCLPLRCPHDARGAADAAGCARRLTPFSLVAWHSPLRLLKLRIITLITLTASLCILFDLPHHDFSFFTLFTLFQLFVLFFGQKEKIGWSAWAYCRARHPVPLFLFLTSRGYFSMSSILSSPMFGL